MVKIKTERVEVMVKVIEVKGVEETDVIVKIEEEVKE